MTSGYKRAEVGVIPEDWDVKSLGTLTKLLTNGFVGTATTAYVSGDSGVLYIQGYNVQENGFNLHGIKRVSHAFHNRNKQSTLRMGDLLTIQTGEIGVTAVVPQELAGANCHALIISRFDQNKSEPSFYSQYLNSDLGRPRLREIETGTTMKHLNCGDMKQLLLPAPPVEEQRHVATALSDVDALLHGLERLIAKKRDLKQGAMQQLLTGKTRLPGYTGAYSSVELRDLAQLSRISINPATTPNRTFTHFSLPAFDEQETPITESGASIESNKFIVPHDAVLLSKLNPRIPRVWAPQYIPDNAVCSTEFLVLQPKSGVNRQFLKMLCTSERVSSQMELHAIGTTGSHQRIQPERAMSIEVTVPSSAQEQFAIAEVLSDMNAELAALTQRLGKTRALKQAMMQELLTGRTRLV